MRLHYRFSGPVTNKVIHSQVVGTLAALRHEGVELDLAGWSGLGHALFHHGEYQHALARLRERLQAPFTLYYTVDRWPWLDQWLKFRELAAAAGAGPAILQTRSHDLANLMAGLRRRRPELRFVYEIRGDLRAERAYKLGGRPDPELPAIERRVGDSLAAADLVLCVSQVLAERLVARHGLDPQRLHVMPCTADEQRFRPDPQLREARRRELGLGSETILLVYSGSLKKGWDVPERIRAFLMKHLERDKRLEALLISPDSAEAESLRRALPSGRLHHRCLDHWEMQGWLVAGDAALLLRESHPLNEVASPTKAAELLLCGLPLLISPGVGDYSAWIRDQGLGHIVTEGEQMSAVDWNAVCALSPERIRARALEAVARTPHVLRLIERLGRL